MSERECVCVCMCAYVCAPLPRYSYSICVCANVCERRGGVGDNGRCAGGSSTKTSIILSGIQTCGEKLQKKKREKRMRPMHKKSTQEDGSRHITLLCELFCCFFLLLLLL